MIDVDARRRLSRHGDHPSATSQLIAKEVGQQKGAEVVGREHHLEALLCLSILAREGGRDVQQRVDVAGGTTDFPGRGPHRVE